MPLYPRFRKKWHISRKLRLDFRLEEKARDWMTSVVIL